jgi:DNA-directed RNA polymerase subunit RPC12/RpoP
MPNNTVDFAYNNYYDSIASDIINDEIDHVDNDTEIVCPYCGFHYDPRELGEDCLQYYNCDTDIECQDCEKVFSVCADITVYYSTKRK